MNNSLDSVTPDLIRRYNVKGPYYTSYPTGKEWTEKFGPSDYRKALLNMTREKKKIPLSLYFHIPFCIRRCRFCFCHTIATKDRRDIDTFLNVLFREMRLLKEFFNTCDYVPDIREIHLGGGSPSYMDKVQFSLLIENIRQIVDPETLDEFAIEIDSITVNKEKLKHYHGCGINRISFGIQDFDLKVQKAIARVQSPRFIEKLLTPETRDLFKSVNFDLMYGLPLQSRESFKRTVETVIGLAPDRIALYSYFHMPEIYKHQADIMDSDLPGVVEKKMIFVEAIKTFTSNGYCFIGIDHFARLGSDLALAEKKGTLCRHFMGYTAGRAPHLIGLGPTSLCGFTKYYAQNVYSIEEYRALVEEGNFPILRGYKMTEDDVIRRDVINNLLCYFYLDFEMIGSKHGIDFSEYFSNELKSLDRFAEDGILHYSKNSIRMTEVGRLFTRHVCMVFDKYLRSSINNTSNYTPVIQRSATSRYLKGIM